MEKLRIARLLAVGLVVCAIAGQAMAVPSIFNTGVDGFGVVLPDGASDTHWALVLPDNSSVQPIATAPNPAWVAAPADSKWIGPASSLTTVALGSYNYTLSFAIDEPGLIPVKLSGSWSTDNSSEIYFNGVFIDARPAEKTYESLKDFEITSGFITGGGMNTLEFRTVNMPTGEGQINPNGLLVALELEMGPAIPAPGAVLLVSLGTCAVGFIRRKGIL